MSSYLGAIEKSLFYLMHFSIMIKIYMECRPFRTVSENSTHNIYPKLSPHMSSYLGAIEKSPFLFNAFLHQNIYGM